jgi:hypothetical protein
MRLPTRDYNYKVEGGHSDSSARHFIFHIFISMLQKKKNKKKKKASEQLVIWRPITNCRQGSILNNILQQWRRRPRPLPTNHCTLPRRFLLPSSLLVCAVYAYAYVHEPKPLPTPNCGRAHPRRRLLVVDLGAEDRRRFFETVGGETLVVLVTLLHDLGGSKTSEVVSADKRSAVDGGECREGVCPSPACAGY